MTTLDVLIAARELVARPGGWCQEIDHLDDYGTVAHCAQGAIAWARPSIAAGRAALDALSVVVGTDYPAISDWNDDPSRTQAEVVAAFDRAIERERATP